MSTGHRTPPRGPATYELTVVGALGPVLRHALEPSATARCEEQTVLHARLGDDTDLEALVLMLACRGLEIVEITDRG